MHGMDASDARLVSTAYSTSTENVEKQKENVCN